MRTSAARALAELEATGQDHEWYPTTNEIIDAFHAHASSFEMSSKRQRKWAKRSRAFKSISIQHIHWDQITKLFVY